MVHEPKPSPLPSGAPRSASSTPRRVNGPRRVTGLSWQLPYEHGSISLPSTLAWQLRSPRASPVTPPSSVAAGVGRTRTLPVEERARLAARAFIRHRFTDYEGRLGDVDVFLAAIDDADYREVKQDAQARVDQFLADHRITP
jgi:hypothetical protein